MSKNLVELMGEEYTKRCGEGYSHYGLECALSVVQEYNKKCKASCPHCNGMGFIARTEGDV